MTVLRRSLGALVATLGISAAAAQAPAPQATPQVFPIAQSGVTFLTGDTFEQNGQRFRLYGVQSCIRGTVYSNPVGTRQDCGDASLALFAALVRDTKPTCSPVAQIPAADAEKATILVVCSAHIAENSPDLGTILIGQGYAFAAFSNDGRPVYMPYVVTEALAKKARKGLWASADFTHPNLVLFKAVNAAK